MLASPKTSPKRIIFLDMDGVILSGPDLWNSSFIPKNRYIPPERVARLNRLAIDAQVVVSSTWRRDATTAVRLLEMGVPIHADWRTGEERGPEGQERGFQIQTWLDRHPEVEAYVILDDDSDMMPGQPLVQCEFEIGLTDKEMYEAMEVLYGY